MAELNLLTLRSTIANLISKNNTNTSDFNIGLNMEGKPKTIVAGYHDNKPTKNIDYPGVWVELQTKAEDHEVIGDNNKRNSTIDFNIVCIVQVGLGQSNGKNISGDEMITFSNNIEKLFRNKIQLSSTSLVTSSLLVGTDYDVTEDQSFYNSIAEISLQVETFST